MYMDRHDFMLGAADWCRPDWTSTFYPEGMPDEWRPAYYGTRFSCVWLPLAAWCGASAALVAQWLDDVRADFRFLLEAGPGAPDPARLALFGERLGAYCRPDHPDLLWFDAGVDLGDLVAELGRRAGQGGTTYLLSRDGDLATLEKVDTLLGILGGRSRGGVG